jgi:ankyrin repeat protein
MGNQQKEVALFLLNRVSLQQVTGNCCRKRFGETALHWAAIGGHEEAVRITFKMRVNPKVMGGEHVQHTAIELGLQQKQFVIAELLTVVE